MSSSESLDADVHLLAIRKALASGSASVMVGAGFSRNAEGGESLATWRQLTQELSMALSPGGRAVDFSPGAAAQLAEQYAKVFSPAHLEMLIKRCVPDDEVSPGKLHSQLLELPWSEIFTTNYDTLLERAAERMFEVGYFTVCAREDIPQSKLLGRRRIVKLHGSFPSHRPFILTEEEYRTYPERFAPFVNMVRQSLLENVFCLIGFSGDDPNFLHWLGWVRDMLDKHALPVYLFLAQEPTLGERKLYEARGVVPVVLPTPNGVAPSNYKARYQTLFDELAKPLENSPMEWGLSSALPFIPSDGDHTASFKLFLQSVADIVKCRDDYPGWIVAPTEVRARFTRVADWLERSLTHSWLLENLRKSQSEIALLVIDCYCWTQRVVLGPIIDDIAEVGLFALLKKADDAAHDFGSELNKLLSSLQASESNSPQRVRARVSMALLTWARQSHHTHQYQAIKQSLVEIQNGDGRVHDHVVYEQILNSLQHADIPSALDQTRRWRPVSANAYAQVLRGALLAELGDTATALAVLGGAIQVLRRQQRSRPSDPELISQEAWACLVARHLQDFAAPSEADDEHNGNLSTSSDRKDDSIGKENLNERLNVLMARGYSAQDELTGFMSKLNAEATQPAPSLRNLVGFDVGTSSTHQVLGASTDLTQKILASFAWLELLERVGLPHRIRNASLYSSQMLQAAWWARFGDTRERSTGLLLRAHRKQALKPRDGHGRPHLTGWLNRHEIALLKDDTATELAQAVLSQIKLDLQDGSSIIGTIDRIEFLLEAFGRFAVRAHESETILVWANDLIELHGSVAFQSHVELWPLASLAITRLIESLPEDMHAPVLLKVFQLPLAPTPNHAGLKYLHQLERWVDVVRISDACRIDPSSPPSSDWMSISAELIGQLRTSPNPAMTSRIWTRLSVMRSLNLLTTEHRDEVGSILWRACPEGSWPVVPGQYISGTLHWPSPMKNPAAVLLDRLLANPLAPFGSGYMQYTAAGSGRTYSMGGEFGAIGQIYTAISFHPPSATIISKAFQRIEEWLDAEKSELLVDINRTEIRDSLTRVCGFVDRIMLSCLNSIEKSRPSKTKQALLDRALAISIKLGEFPFPHIRLTAKLLSFQATSKSKLLEDAKKVAYGISSETAPTSSDLFRASFDLLSMKDTRIREAGQLVFDTLVAAILMRRADNLAQTLNLLSCLPKQAWRRFSNKRTLSLIDIALSDMHTALNYRSALHSDSLLRELIPQSRFYAVKLAYAMVEVNGIELPGARIWLEEAKSDPLPEVRLGRYKVIDV